MGKQEVERDGEEGHSAQECGRGRTLSQARHSPVPWKYAHLLSV
jgi:hypothetical protein